MAASTVQASDLIVIGQVIGMVDTSPGAAARKTLEMHRVLVERTIRGIDETGLQLRIRPNGNSWVDGERYLLFLKGTSLHALESVPGSSLLASSGSARAALDQIAATRPAVTPQRTIWVRHDAGWGGGMRMEFWMAANGAFEYQSQPAARGAATASATALAGQLPAGDAAALMNRLRSAGAGPAADDLGVVTIRLVAADSVPEFRVYSVPGSPPASDFLRGIGELAHKYGKPKG